MPIGDENPGVGREREGLQFVVGQDCGALEALEENLQLLNETPREVSCRNDAGTLRGRRIVEKMIVKSGVDGAGRAQNKWLTCGP
jgi:hypothetical protein